MHLSENGCALASPTQRHTTQHHLPLPPTHTLQQTQGALNFASLDHGKWREEAKRRTGGGGGGGGGAAPPR